MLDNRLPFETSVKELFPFKNETLYVPDNVYAVLSRIPFYIGSHSSINPIKNIDKISNLNDSTLRFFL